MKRDIIPESFYRESEFVGFRENGRHYTPSKMSEIFNRYERLLRLKNFEAVKKEESANNYPQSWLNSIIFNLIKEKGKGLAKRLISSFEDRGFDKTFLSK
ncbi:MAG: hypothetical protein WC438_04865 [Candidatus Pacearchaeota archaeon]